MTRTSWSTTRIIIFVRFGITVPESSTFGPLESSVRYQNIEIFWKILSNYIFISHWQTFNISEYSFFADVLCYLVFHFCKQQSLHSYVWSVHLENTVLYSTFLGPALSSWYNAGGIKMMLKHLFAHAFPSWALWKFILRLKKSSLELSHVRIIAILKNSVCYH